MNMPIQRQMPVNNMYRPKMPPVENMCDRCPFKPDGTGYTGPFQPEGMDLAGVVRSVALGLPFPCHETFIMDSKTNVDAGLNQQHVRSCLGATLYKQGKLALSDEVMKSCEPDPTSVWTNPPFADTGSGRKRRSQRSKSRSKSHKRTRTKRRK